MTYTLNQLLHYTRRLANTLKRFVPTRPWRIAATSLSPSTPTAQVAPLLHATAQTPTGWKTPSDPTSLPPALRGGTARAPEPPLVRPRLSPTGIVTVCQHCGQRSLHKQAVACEQPGRVHETPPMAHVYHCHTCTENYLSIVYFEDDGSRVETWRYYLDDAPCLEQVVRYQREPMFGEQVFDSRTYYLDYQPASEADWHAAREQLRRRLSWKNRGFGEWKNRGLGRDGTPCHPFGS